MSELNLEGKTIIGDPVSGTDDSPEKLIVTLNGETVEVKADPNLNVLETLLNEGHSPPYSCMDGACMACMAKVTSGTIYQDDPGILTDDNIEDRETLTCQAKPVSKVVELNYDDL